MAAVHAFPYSGKSEYCFSNSLHMVVSHLAPPGWRPPEPAFIECLTTVPFGSMLLDLPSGPLFFPSPAGVDPEVGLDRAIAALGWECDQSAGAPQATASEAMERLRSAVWAGPAIAGPLDLGELPHNPRAKYLKGGDHYVEVLAADGKEVVFHDPYGFPYTRLPADDFLQSWRGDRIPYKQGPYTLRARFRPIRPRTRSEAAEQVLPMLAEIARSDPGGPVIYGGAEAVARTAANLRTGPDAGLVEFLTYFSIPLGARRRLDAARFLEEFGRTAAAARLDAQARILGALELMLVQGRWADAASRLDEFGSSETALVAELERR